MSHKTHDFIFCTTSRWEQLHRALLWSMFLEGQLALSSFGTCFKATQGRESICSLGLQKALPTLMK
ncbi:hypothetical protein Z949_1745 [Sulfitobacter guttiformis KCTC 32187]|nr:hypothetical protein Z949_1745 [Sulfitobacter guttiformis KCTC 32187]